MSPKKIAQYLEKQKQWVKTVKDYGLISKEFLLSMRKFGYNSTFKALAEFIDNSIQALSTEITVLIKTVPGQKRMAKPYVGEIAMIDNGFGMEPDMMRVYPDKGQWRLILAWALIFMRMVQCQQQESFGQLKPGRQRMCGII